MTFFEIYAATPESVGDWDGEEELAATQVNRIYQAIDRNLPRSVDPRVARNIFNRVWDDWGYDLRLLDITEDDIQQYARSLLRTAA